MCLGLAVYSIFADIVLHAVQKLTSGDDTARTRSLAKQFQKGHHIWQKIFEVLQNDAGMTFVGWPDALRGQVRLKPLRDGQNIPAGLVNPKLWNKEDLLILMRATRRGELRLEHIQRMPDISAIDTSSTLFPTYTENMLRSHDYFSIPTVSSTQTWANTTEY